MIDSLMIGKQESVDIANDHTVAEYQSIRDIVTAVKSSRNTL